MTRVASINTAISEALHEEMMHDDKMLIFGEDMTKEGNVYGLLQGFDYLNEFGPLRIFDTPISESGFTGMAVGMAMRGMHPVVEWMYNDFVTVCLDPVVNQAAKLRCMTGGQVALPIVFRAPMGMGGRNAAQHSQSLEALFTHIPGLKVVCPSTPKDAKGLLKSAIRDDDPVIYLEHKFLYETTGELPDGDFTIPLGEADIKRSGKDVTIITYSRQVHYALEAAEILAQEHNIDVEVLDLRTLVPLDWDAIKRSVEKTGRVITVEEGVRRGGIGAEICAQIGEELFHCLKAPVMRVASANVVTSFSPPLEDAIFPHPDTIVKAAQKIMQC